MTIHSLNSQRIDLKGRLDQRVEVDPTGIPSLDLALGGGLQPGRGLLISGMSGSGKSSLLLKFAYLFARTGSQVLFSQPGLEAAEILARLGARALHRNYRNATATFGTVLSGLALQDENYRGPVNDSLDQVFEKIGERLFLHEAKAYQSQQTIDGQFCHSHW